MICVVTRKAYIQFIADLRVTATFPYVSNNQVLWGTATLPCEIQVFKNCSHGSYRPKCVWTEENRTAVEKLVQSQDEEPQKHRSTWEILRQTV